MSNSKNVHLRSDENLTLAVFVIIINRLTCVKYQVEGFKLTSDEHRTPFLDLTSALNLTPDDRTGMMTLLHNIWGYSY